MDKLSVKEYKDPFEEKGIREGNRNRRKKSKIKIPFEGKRESKAIA